MYLNFNLVQFSSKLAVSAEWLQYVRTFYWQIQKLVECGRRLHVIGRYLTLHAGDRFHRAVLEESKASLQSSLIILLDRKRLMVPVCFLREFITVLTN